MPTLLGVDSSPMLETSVPRQPTEEFVQRWSLLHRNGRVISRDLMQTQLAPVTTQWITAAYKPEESRSSEQKHILEVSDTLIAELEAGA